jgi:hypothetical protein
MGRQGQHALARGQSGGVAQLGISLVRLVLVVNRAN